MGEISTTRSLLSQDEINALLSSLVNHETAKSGMPGRSRERAASTSIPTTEPQLENDLLESPAVCADIRSAKLPFTLPAVLTPAASFDQFLTVEEILRSCRRALTEHLCMGRVSLVRTGCRDTATVYSVDEDGNSPLIGPRVISLEPSRLNECALRQQVLIVYDVPGPQLDRTETNYLVRTGPNSGLVSLVYWPLAIKGEVRGVLVLTLPETERLTSDRTALLSHVSNLVTIALENCDRTHVERRRNRQLEVVSEVAKQAAGRDDFDEFLDNVCDLLRRSFDYDSVEIWLKTYNQLDLVGEAGRTSGGTIDGKRAPAIVQECKERCEILCNSDRASKSVTEETEPKSKSQVAAPIDLQTNVLGVLFVESVLQDTFDAGDLSTLESVASLIATRLHHSQVFKNLRRSDEYLQAILRSANDWAILSTDVHGYILTCSVGVQRVFHLAQQDILGKDILSLFSNPNIQQELITRIREGTAPSALERYRVPQTNGENTTYIDVTFQQVQDFEKHHIGFLCVVRDVTENALLERKLHSLSITDDLTGLFNQRGSFRVIESEVKRCRRFGENFSLCFFDLDGLKRFNDNYGHLCGSQVLKETARLLQELVRDGVDTCGRYGGDEFLVVMPHLSKTEAQVLIEEVRVKLTEHFQGQITASFGIEDFSDKALEGTELLARADKAMYRAKSQGKNCVVLSD